MVSEHTVKSYDDELKNLNQTIAQMGGLAEAQLQSAIEALVRRGDRKARRSGCFLVSSREEARWPTSRSKWPDPGGVFET